MVSFVFPGHNYLGPGNELDSGVPVDSDDAIAREHDKAYEVAECKSDIYAADDRAIFAFMFDWLQYKNWHSALGAICLSFKTGTERLFHTVFYPRFGSTKGNRAAHSDDADVTKPV